MNKQKLRKIFRRTIRKPMFWSCFMHFIIIVAASINFSFFWSNRKDLAENPPIFIDLSKVEIDEVTNLPTEVKKVPPKPNFKVQKPEPEKPFYTPPKPENRPAATKPKVVVEIKNKQEPKQKSDGARLDVPVPEKQAEKQVKKPKKQEENSEPKDNLADLGSLLSSIEENKINYQPVNYKSEEKAVSEGIKGGIGGDLSRKVTITDKDALISRIRACWNVEAGVKGAEKIIVEIRAKIASDGQVLDVDILDRSRYNSDGPFRTIADSARRAIYVCEKKGKDSPFMILANKYKDTYDSWKDLYLRFSPIEGVGF